MAYLVPTESSTVTITQDERTFFVSLGGHIAALRKEAHLTQVLESVLAQAAGH